MIKSFNIVKYAVVSGIFITGLLFVGYQIRDLIFFYTVLFYAVFGIAIIVLLLASIIVGVWYWRKTKRIKPLLLIPGVTWLIFLMPAVFSVTLDLLTDVFEYEWIVTGKVEFLDRITYPDEIYMHEWIYAKNMPKNILKRNKIIIAYFDSTGISTDDFINKMPEIKWYKMEFERLTEHDYVETGIDPFYGYVHIYRCENDPAKCILTTRVSISRDGLRLSEVTVLLNECDSGWYDANKNNELVKYYKELRDKKNTNSNKNNF